MNYGFPKMLVIVEQKQISKTGNNIFRNYKNSLNVIDTIYVDI